MPESGDDVKSGQGGHEEEVEPTDSAARYASRNRRCRVYFLAIQLPALDSSSPESESSLPLRTSSLEPVEIS